mmetsp:Transcript_4227/g.10864  ORF Transcript_4227/g.10864 Transcript_4227/m.10864 type:complete len:271 (-) Transcript_4227:598-1410(-)
MKTTTGCGVAGSISVLFAFSIISTFLANSITATCIPKQIPRKGMLFSRANLHVSALPSVPRPPNPPGTRMPSHFLMAAQARLCFSAPSSPPSFIDSSRSDASIQQIFSLRLAAIAACCSAFITLKYESVSPVYLPTMAISTCSCRLSHLMARSSHWSIFNPCGGVMFSCLQSASCTPWSLITKGTCQMFDTSDKFMTWVAGTWQKRASLSFTDCSRGSLLRQARKLGAIPTERSTWTLCWVGLVFCSPTTPRTGTRLTCTEHTSCGAFLN